MCYMKQAQLQIISLLSVAFEYRTGGDVGPALGAAKLAQIALNPNEDIANFCQPLPLEAVYQPNPKQTAFYAEKRQKFAELYQRLKGL